MDFCEKAAHGKVFGLEKYKRIHEKNPQTKSEKCDAQRHREHRRHNGCIYGVDFYFFLNTA